MAMKRVDGAVQPGIKWGRFSAEEAYDSNALRCRFKILAQIKSILSRAVIRPGYPFHIKRLG